MTAADPTISSGPQFSVVVPLYNTTPFLLQEMVASVQLQSYEDWELVLVDDASPDPRTRETARACAASDPRIVLIELPENRNISEASNAGIDAARGAFVALLDHDDTLDPRALAMVQDAIEAGVDIDYVYTDQDVMTDKGHYRIPFAKPEWSPERLLGQMFTSHLSVFRTSLLREVGPFNSAYNGSQDHDLVLRFTEQARGIAHVPEVLYHWRAVPGSTALNGSEKSYAWDAGLAAVTAAVERRGIDAEVAFGPNFGTYAVRHRLQSDRTLSILVAADATTPRLDALLAELDASDVAAQIVELIVALPAGRDASPVTRAPGRFPVSFVQTTADERTRLLHEASVEARGDLLVLLGESLTELQPETLTRLAGALGEPDVAFAGGRIVFSDETVKHAGYRKSQTHLRDAFRGWPAGTDSTYGALTVNREVSAVSTEFAVIDRLVFEAVGGFNAELDGYCAELDLAAKVWSQGNRVLTLCEPIVTSLDRSIADDELPKRQRKVISRRWGWKGVDLFTP
ncbi:glycosyltransferase [Plantibacter sp. LMC-P-059a]|uniref:glycosyltransferase family 2 protein n=1 Tax=Plantibacter sp. LMC-P-059a TaxID=3040297 RepID=UPI00254EA515|nr:glycosyltransferase [Plantibacter sp. LMC-P-059a]